MTPEAKAQLAKNLVKARAAKAANHSARKAMRGKAPKGKAPKIVPVTTLSAMMNVQAKVLDKQATSLRRAARMLAFLE